MSSLDMRTRTAADIREVDVADFFTSELPSLIESRGALARDGARLFEARPITFVTPSGSWTLALSGDDFTISAGDSGESAVSLSDDHFADAVNDLTTPTILRTLGQLRVERGDAGSVETWWAVLRSLLDNRPMHTTGAVEMLDREGRPLDLNRSFTPEDDDADIAHFLEQAGFLHLSGWLDPALMAEIADDMDREFAKCAQGDGSWWAKLEDGSQRPVRFPNFHNHSEAVRRLVRSEPFLRIGRLTDDGYVPSTGMEALQKPRQVVVGNSDLPWHHDCTQGMHSYKCCMLVVGVSVTGAGPGSAQLGVIPGSHRALMPADRHYPESGLEPRLLTTRTGDMTVHCSCTMHMAKSPTEYERKVLYGGFTLPSDAETDAEMAKVNERRSRTLDATSA